ncbi:hypothetical protein WJX72_006902 [[Myrmecia] bisecta]|uniref:Queuosine 5'-phosphate N-glycosylase/hydrolase n=1 Tax=[Myrmecia] bisecta TaxID=41462 RepID=A0AAW1PLW6_9CHLO
MPGRANGTVLDTISRSAAAAAAAAPEDCSIDVEAVQRYASSLNVSQVQEAGVPTRLPVRFESVQQEVNFLATMHLLDFGSGYDPQLLQTMRRDARETLQFGVLGMHISDKKIDAQFMKEFSNFAVANYFGIQSHIDQQVQPGITMSRPGPLLQLTQQIRQALNSTGAALEDAGSADLGSLIMSSLESRRASGQAPSASSLVEYLTTAIPVFADEANWRGQQVVFQRKAQLLAFALYQRFAPELPDLFGFVDAEQLTADSGNVVPAALHRLGILKYSNELEQAIAAQQPLTPGSDQEVALRAAAINAVAQIVQATGQALTGPQLSIYLQHYLESTTQIQAPGKGVKHLAPGSLAY